VLRTVRIGAHARMTLTRSACHTKVTELFESPTDPRWRLEAGVMDRHLPMRMMRPMPAVTYTPTRPATWTDASSLTLPFAWTRIKIAFLIAATTLAFAFRVSALSTYGFSEDELNKVTAIEEYRAGHFTANAEHPMLMKLAMWGSVDAAAAWNRVAPEGRTMSLETALRLPNAIAGAATTVGLFGVADLLFGGAVASVVSAIWAFDVNAIAINRIGKEDTFLLFFFVLAVF